MEHNHGGLVQIIFLSKWVICMFQPLIFQSEHVFFLGVITGDVDPSTPAPPTKNGQMVDFCRHFWVVLGIIVL